MTEKLTKAETDFLLDVAHVRRLGTATREQDKTRQSMRRAGLVIFDRSVGKWRITPEGRAALTRSTK